MPADAARRSPEITARASSLLIQPEGVLVISDIDDTVKVTEVFMGKDMVVRNTFLEEFRAVSGMVSLYQSWSKEPFLCSQKKDDKQILMKVLP